MSARFERHLAWKMAATGSSRSGPLPYDKEESGMGVAKKTKQGAKSIKGKAKKGAGKVKHKSKKAKNAAKH
jgi:hypothetical protein